MRIVRGPRALLLMVVLCAFTLTGCRGLTDVKLPGGTAGKHPYKVTVLFDDVLNLEQQGSVRVNDVAVGDVEKIRNQGFKAAVTLRIRKDVVLPANTYAQLEQTSLFGEKFVALGPPPPPEEPVGQLKNGAVIDRSGRNPETEEVLAALSALLNGGGVAQLQTISVELSNALAGREGKVRDSLRQLDKFIGALDDRKQEIVRALQNVDALGRRLAAQTGTLASALDNIPPALAVLADQRTQLTRMLTSLSNLGHVSDDVIANSRANTVQVLNNLQPILANLDSARQNIVSSLELLTNYPFPTTVLNGVHGDYTGLYATVDLNLNDLIRGLSSSQAGGGSPTSNTGPLGCQGGTNPLCPVTQNVAPSNGSASPQVVTPKAGVAPNVVSRALTGQGATAPGGSDYTAVILQGMGQ